MAFTHTQDVGNKVNFADYEDLGHFLVSYIKPNVKEDLQRYADSGKDISLLPDNQKYLRLISKAGDHFGFKALEIAQIIVASIKLTEDMPADLKAAAERLRDFSKPWSGHGSFTRADDFIIWNNYLADNGKRFEAAIAKAEAIIGGEK